MASAARSPLTGPSPLHAAAPTGHSSNATTASNLRSPSPGVHPPSSRASGYFPQQDRETLSNTLANSNIVSPLTEAQSPLVAPVPTRPTKFTEEWDASQRGSSIMDGAGSHMQRSNSFSGSAAGDSAIQLSRSNTLKKKPSLRRGGSLHRSSSRRSMKAGSVRSLALQSNPDEDEVHSAFYCPVPTSGNPTEVLANRFQAWRKILKDLITYFREVQNHYEHRSKSLVKLANVLNNMSMPPGFVTSGGLDDALQILRNYNKQAVLEANKAREIEEDVILALTGLRSDLQQKIKEIKNLAGDFKNSVEKEMDATRRAVKSLQAVLGQSELDSALTTGKQDPYLLRLAVDRQLEKQIDEENYLHQAYLNLENSGRELESIVVGEIQKSYNAYAGIVKREADAALGAVDELRIGPVSMPKDHEWAAFVHKDEKFVDPEVPIRSADFIYYPGKDHYASQEIRAGLLERKSKYLKSYAAGWYVLSPTHLHEFKSADKTQAPVMSLYLPEQKLGSHSTEGGSSNKFILKGRQTGGMHRGHTWVFRAESHDTMMAWYEDIKALTEKTPQERSEFVRGHTRSFSRSSQRSFSSDGVVDEEDDVPFAADAAAGNRDSVQEALPRRPSPGGRFPSDLQVNAQRGLQVPLSPSSVGSGFLDQQDREAVMGTTAGPVSGMVPQHLSGHDAGSGRMARSAGNEAASSQDLGAEGAAVTDGRGLSRQNTGGTAGSVAGTSTMASSSTASIARRDRISGQAGRQESQSGGLGSGAMPPEEAVMFAGATSYPPQSQANGQLATRGAGTDAGGRRTVAEAQNGPRTEPGKQIRGTVMTAGGRKDSVQTLSNLHVPGEYPRGTPMG